MAPLKIFLSSLLLLFSASNATQPPRTLHVPVVHRDAVFPPPPDAKRSGLRRHLAAAGARYTAPPPLSSTAHDRGLLHSPVISGSPLGSGEYFALVGVGTPSTDALLVIDTGSDLTWLQCKPCPRCYDQVSPLYDPRGSSTYRQIPCTSPRCHMLEYPGCHGGRAGACRYLIAYGDGSASTGDLAVDSLRFSGDTYIHNVTLGCGHDNEGPFDSATGLLGVGRGNLSFPTQVAAAYGHFFAYCLSDHAPRAGVGGGGGGSSYLVFGRAPETPSTAFTPLLTNPRRPSLYYVDMAGFSVGGSRVVGFSNASLALDPATGRGGVVVDSGTAISRLAGEAYAALRDSFDARAAADGMRRVVIDGDGEDASAFDACYDLGGGEMKAAVAKVPSVVLHFAGGADMALPPENYLVPVEGGKGRTYYCLGFEAAADGLSVLGNVQQRGFRVVFDVEKGRVGFAPSGCSIGF